MNGEPSPLDDYRAVGELFGALASPARAAILHRLIDGQQTVSDLVEALGLSQPLVSQHMRVLRSARLVNGQRRGREITYSLTDKHVAHVFLDAYNHTKEKSDDDH